MKKAKFILKKTINLLLILTFTMTMFLTPVKKVHGKTLRDIKNEVDAAEKALSENKKNQKDKTGEMSDIKTTVYNNLIEVDKIVKNIAVLNEEIEEYNGKIETKSEEIKKLLNFVQKAKGTNIYLEYVFDAKDFADFIYRFAVAKQLFTYNKELINDYNNLIEENNESKSTLEQEQENLIAKREALELEYNKLSADLRTIEDAEPTLEENLKLQKETYQFYLDLGCKLDDDLDVCGKKLLPPSTKLYRPLESGQISSSFGDRCYWLRGKKICDFHKGVDLAKSGSAVPVYSSGTGVVVYTATGANKWSCGGQVVIINHNINGKYYHTSYLHLRKVFVKKGDMVDKDTIIAYEGGNPSIETWDTCTTGQHLHFTVSEGMFTTYSKTKANALNPVTMVNFPAPRVNWYDRITKY